MKSVHKIFLILVTLSLSTNSFAVGLTQETEVVKRFIRDLNTTYPYLLNVAGSVNYQKIKEQLSQEITNQTELLKIQSEIYETLNSNEETYYNWYAIYHELHINTVRNSKYAKQRFSELLNSLLSKTNTETYDRLLVPASGKFFEFPDVLAHFNPSLVVAKDIDNTALEFTRGMFGDNPKLVLKHSDLSKTQHDETYYDAAIFIHPHVTNHEKLSESETYLSYESEFHIPYAKIKNQSKIDYISKTWTEIILNSLSLLKVNGYAFFIFYEHRELDIVSEWLKPFAEFKIIHSLYNDNMIDFAFSKDYLKTIGTEQEKNSKICINGRLQSGLAGSKKKVNIKYPISTSQPSQIKRRKS